MRKRATRWAVLSASVLCSVSLGRVTLYDSGQPTFPDQQGSLAFQNLLGTGTETLPNAIDGPVVLNTSGGTYGNQEYAGYSNYNSSGRLVNPAFPNFTSANGFELTFDAKLNSESHTSNDRAGFDIILLGSDLSGIELGFWQGQVWAQATNASNAALDFTHAESSTSFNPTFDPESTYYNYDLEIQGGVYTLTANGALILTGPTRNYSAYPTPPGAPDPYKIPNFLFLGDDTNVASGVESINSIFVSAPEPGSFSLLVLAGCAMLAGRRRSSC